MKLSHSKMQLLLKDPMSYHLKYDLGISAIETKPALSIGSAVHWGLEHSTSNLDEYYNNPDYYSDEQGLAEAMVEAYLQSKDEIFDLILTKKDGSKLNLTNEIHELFINSELMSFAHPEKKHLFIGIADLLLETDEGLILIDYKTSSREPDWNGYLEQIYRYIFMLRNVFPDKPVFKIGIINIRKAALRQKASESKESYYKRMKDEYKINANKYVYTHMFKPEELNQDLLNAYIQNLSKMADAAEMIVKNKMYYINFGAQNDYGKAEYYDIFYKTPGAYALYNISDTILDDAGIIKTEKDGGRRQCNEYDIDMIDDPKLINKYDQFKEAVIEIVQKTNSFESEIVFQELKEKYIINDDLLSNYWIILNKELSSEVIG